MYEHHRFPRRAATVQIARFWSHIISLSQRQNIPMSNVAIRVDYTCFPFKFHVIDRHELLDATKHPPGHVVVANELRRRSDADREKCMIAILRMAGRDVPYIIHPDCAWSKDVSVAPDDLPDEETTTYVSQDGEKISCDNFDALRAGVHLVRKSAEESGVSVWDANVISKAVDDVMRLFWDGESTTSDSSDVSDDYSERVGMS